MPPTVLAVAPLVTTLASFSSESPVSATAALSAALPLSLPLSRPALPCKLDVCWCSPCCPAQRSQDSPLQAAQCNHRGRGELDRAGTADTKGQVVQAASSAACC